MSRKLNIAILGMGQRTCFHGGCIFKKEKADVQITALCDIHEDRLMHAKVMYEEEFGYQINTYTNYLEMYKNEDLDGVFISGPNYLHKDMTIHAFEAGIHVLCEKPMELNLARCDEMIMASKQHNKILALAMQIHYREHFHKIQQIIRDGVIGEVAMLWCTEYRGPFLEMKDWVWEKSKSGGAIHEKNCHHYDVMDLWAESSPTTVYATGGIAKHTERSGIRSEIIDNAWIVNDYESGARGMVGICFLAEDRHEREFGIQGTKGKIYIHSNDDEVIHVSCNDGRQEKYEYFQPDKGFPELKGGVFKDFVDCIREEREPMVTPERGKNSMLVPMAAEISIEEKRIVHVNELK